MSEMQGQQRSAVVFGARNLGRAIIELLVSDGWAVARSGAIAQHPGWRHRRRRAGAQGRRDRPRQRATPCWRKRPPLTAESSSSVNAAAAYGGDRTGPFGGGPIAEATLDGFDAWATAPARAAFSFLSASGRFTTAQRQPRDGGTGHRRVGRRAMPGRGLWAAGSFGVRAITHAAALELRPQGIQVTLPSSTPASSRSTDPPARAPHPKRWPTPTEIADAVLFLANQNPRSATHELQLTPLAENWTP